MSATFRNCHHLLSHSIYDLDLAIGDLVARSEALEMKEARTLMTRLYYVDSEGQGEEEHPLQAVQAEVVECSLMVHQKEHSLSALQLLERRFHLYSTQRR